LEGTIAAEMERHQSMGREVVLRADAAFTKPEI
jgi:hypothetical protein